MFAREVVADLADLPGKSVTDIAVNKIPRRGPLAELTILAVDGGR
jgi:hypothetical protein